MISTTFLDVRRGAQRERPSSEHRARGRGPRGAARARRGDRRASRRGSSSTMTSAPASPRARSRSAAASTCASSSAPGPSAEHADRGRVRAVTRQLRAIRRRWEVARAARGHRRAGRRSRRAIASPSGSRPTCKGLASIDRATQRVRHPQPGGAPPKLIASARTPDELEASRWPFLARRALATHAPGSSHGEIVDPDAYAMSFWYDARSSCCSTSPTASTSCATAAARSRASWSTCCRCSSPIPTRRRPSAVARRRSRRRARPTTGRRRSFANGAGYAPPSSDLSTLASPSSAVRCM